MGDDYGSEEDVKFKFLVPYLRERGYDEKAFSFNQSIEVQEGRKTKTIFADLVVYASEGSDAPLVLCETKGPDEVLDRKVRDQGISYARLLPKIAPIVLTTNGAQVQVFQTLNKNRIKTLPTRSELTEDVINFVVSAELQEALRQEARHELFIIDDVQVFKRVLRSCHNEIRNNEGYDPVAAFDEMSKVLFCKLYEEKVNPEKNRFRLDVFDDTLDRLGVNVVRQIFEETKGSDAYSGLFAPQVAIDLNDRTIRKIVELFESYDLSLTAFDVKGEAFEFFLSDTFTGGLGEYFTPRNVVEFMVDAIDPRIGEYMVDPFCGTGGFLIYAFDVVGEKIRIQEFSDEEKERWRLDLSNRALSGSDWKERTAQACKMNMMVHGDGSAGIFKAHGLQDVENRIVEGAFNICLTNPPFGANEKDKAILDEYELGAGRKSQDRMVLATERAIRLIKPGGRIAIVVAEGLLDNDSTRYVRDYVRTHTWVRGVIALGRTTFEGYGAGAKTCILLLEKKQEPDDGRQEPTFFGIAENTGYAPNGAPVPGNELPDILLAWQAHQRGEMEPTATAWVADIDDRLDPKFYRTRSAVPAANVEDVSGAFEQRLAATLSDYQGFAGEVARAYEETEFEPVALGDLVEEVQVRETLDDDLEYRLLGVRWWGGGTFIREAKRGRDIKATSACRVTEGWLIYNRLFAFRGSFAVVPSEHTGCHVSTEFPTFVAREHVENPELVIEYIAHAMCAPQILQAIDNQSTGSTKQSRNRWNQEKFNKFQLQVPTDAAGLDRMVAVLAKANRLRAIQQEMLDMAKDIGQGVSLMLPE
jgi:type I restriction enzyme M protein